MKNEFVILSAFFLFMLLSFVGAHETSGDVFVRVVSSDPASRTYTFSCSMDPENGYLRDWFIRPDSGTTDSLPEEAIILDKPAGEHLTYTFEENGFYHIGCVIVDESDFSKNYRGDLHIDLRNNEWDPEVVPVSGSGKSVTLMCDYSGDASGASWEVVDAKTGAVSSIGSGQTITHSVSGHGLYDYVCKVGGKGTGLPIEFFDQGDPYFPDEFGVPHGVKKVWLRGTQPPQNDSGNETQPPQGTGILRTDTDGGLNAQFVCKPSGASDDLTVDWNFGDGQQVFDDDETVSHSFSSEGSYFVQCGAWDNSQGKFYQESKFFSISGSGTQPPQNDTNGTQPPQNQSGFGVLRTDTDGGLATSFLCKPEGASSDLTVDWNFGDGQEIYDDDENVNHVFASAGNYFVQCGAWDSLQGKFYQESKFFSVSGSGGQPPQNDSGGNETPSGSGLQRVDTDGGLGVVFLCRPDGASNDLVVDWNFGDGNSILDTDEQVSHSYSAAGNYFVQCDVWDNAQAKFTSLSKFMSVSGAAQNDSGNETQQPQNQSGFGVLRTDTDGGLATSFLCKPEGASSDLTVDWNFGDGQEIYDDDENVNHVFASGGNYFVQCGAWDNVNSQYFQESKFFSVSGSGGQPPQNDSGNISLNKPVWLSHTGVTGVSPSYFHLEAQESNLPGQHQSSDWEIWNNAKTQRVWNALGKTGELRQHIHTPDGVFEGLSGALQYSTTYQARVRFKDNSGQYTAWSDWRTFTTSAPPDLDPSSPDWSAANGFKVELFADGLDLPVQVAAAPQGMYSSLPDNQEPYLYVTELYGKVKVIHKDGSQSVYADNLLNFDPFGSITGGGQMGVIGLYVMPETGDLFVGTTYVDNGQIKNKVLRFYSTDDGNGFTNVQTVIDNLPSSASHQIEQITRGPDGKLYVNLGDALNPSNAQNDAILAGKIIRMNLDGSNVEVYAKGFRNPFGADWRPGTNQLFSTDNAPDQNDRVVKVVQGENYGWGLNDNFATWNSKAIFFTAVSPVDIEFNPGGNVFPDELDGKMYVAVAGPVYQQGRTSGKQIHELTLDGSGNVVGNREFVRYTGNGYGTPLGLDFTADGLYFTDIYGEDGASGFGSDGRIYRVVPGTPGNGEGPGGNFRSTISISTWYPKLNEAQGIVEYEFTCNAFDGSGNYVYDWYFGDGSKLLGNDFNKKLHNYQYHNKDYTVSCVVHDLSNGQQVSSSMIINPGNFIPEN